MFPYTPHDSKAVGGSVKAEERRPAWKTHLHLEEIACGATGNVRSSFCALAAAGCTELSAADRALLNEIKTIAEAAAIDAAAARANAQNADVAARAVAQNAAIAVAAADEAAQTANQAAAAGPGCCHPGRADLYGRPAEIAPRPQAARA